jgi:hypothetical protein
MAQEKKNSKENINDEDYVFRFKLDETDSKNTNILDDPLAEMTRSQLEALLNIVILTYKGQGVKVDGFTFLNDRETIYKIFPVSDGDK